MAKPVVDGLEIKLEGKLKVARFNVENKAGRQLAQRYGINTLPGFVLLDPKGNVLYRKNGGAPDGDAVATKLGEIAAVPD